MSVVVVATRPYLTMLLPPGSKLLHKIQTGSHELGISRSVEKAYRGALRKHGMSSIIPERRIEEVHTKLETEGKLVRMTHSQIQARVKNVKMEQMLGKYLKFVELAIASNARHLLTQATAHFLQSSKLLKDHGIQVVEPDDFLSLP